MRPVVHTVRGPQAAGETFVDGDAKSREGEPGVATDRHPRSAGVVLFARERDAVLPDSDNGRHDADLEATAFQRFSLFDMGFQISDVPSAVEQRAGAAGQAGIAQRLTHGPVMVAVARRVDLVFGDAADIGAAAKEASEMSFLVAPRCNLDCTLDIRIAIDDARGLEGIDDAERSIEPARVILAFQMRPRQQSAPGPGAGADNVADAVDLTGKAGFGKPLQQPLQGADVRLGKRRLVNAGLVGADGAQGVEVGENAGAVGA